MSTGTTPRTCEVCGKKYYPKQTRHYWQKFCSNACKQKAKREREKEKTKAK